MFGLWRDSEWLQLVDDIRMADVGAAQTLYDSYGDLIREALHRYSGSVDVEESVLSVFLSALRRVRYCDINTRRDFEQVLDLLAREQALLLHHRDHPRDRLPEITLYRKGELLNSVFMQLDRMEREIVLRAYVLDQRESDIAADLEIATADVERAEIKARRLYVNIHRQP